MSLVYIDREGNFGNAEGAVIFDLRELTDDERKSLRETLDKGVSLWEWVYSVNEKDKPPVGSRFHIIKESITIASQRFIKRIDDSAGFLMGE
jgi:hypothetical protein